MDAREKIKKAWDGLEATTGLMDDKARQEFEQILGRPPTISEPVFVQEFIDEINKSRKLIEIAFRLQRIKTEEDLAMASRKMGVKAAQIATQRFQRRVDIAEFVLFAIYTPPELFIPLAKNEPLPKKRINWKEMVTEWNQEHPSDPMTSTTVFRITFYKILREEKVLREILRRELAETETFRQLLSSATEQLQQLEQSERFQELPLPVKEKYYQSVNWIYRLSKKEAQNEERHSRDRTIQG